MNLRRLGWVLLLMLGTSMMKLQAGHYETTLTGGGPVEIIPTGGSPWYLNYVSDNPNGTRTGFSFSGVKGPPPAAGPGSVKCEGTITVQFTWTEDYPGDPEPAPTKAVIRKYAYASFLGRTGSCSNGLGDAPVGDANSQTSQGTTYELKSGSVAQMESFSITITPYAQATLDDPPLGDGIMAAAAEVKVICRAEPLDIQLSGGIQNSWNKRYLIGQLCGATIRSPLLEVDSWNWTATGGSAFKSWTATRDAGGPMVPLGSETGPAFSWHFKTPTSIGRATCGVHLKVPPGANPPGGFNTTLQRNCQIDPPQTKSLSAYTRQNAGQYASPNYGQPPPPGYPYPSNGVGLYWEPSVDRLTFLGVYAPGYPDTENSVGIRWDGIIDTGSLYGGGGGWHFVQIVRPNRWRVNQGVSQHLVCNGMEILDTTYPYEPPPFDPMPLSPGTFNADGTPGIVGDGPAVPLDPPTITQTSALDSFDLWMMYRPPGVGSTFVPIKKLSWFWAGDAQRTIPNPWVLVSSDSGWGFAGDYPAFPAWVGYMNEYLRTTWLP